MAEIGEQIADDKAIAPVANAGSASHAIGEARIRRKIFKRRIVEFVSRNPLWPNFRLKPWPWHMLRFFQNNKPSPLGTIVHDRISRDHPGHFMRPLPPAQ